MSRRSGAATKDRVVSCDIDSCLAPAVALRMQGELRVPTEDEIRMLAYRKWMVAGMPNGDGVNFWLEAERELQQAVWPPSY